MAGNKPPETFIRDTFSQTPLKEINHRTTHRLLGAILSLHAVYSGIRDGIVQEVKQDIKRLIFRRFAHLSLEEVSIAFEWERQRVYGSKTEHYQFFSTDYVAEILEKYTQHKAKIRYEKQIDPPQSPTPTLPKPTPEQEFWLNANGVMRNFEYFKAHQRLHYSASWYYQWLYRWRFLPTHTSAFREQINQRVMQYFQSKALQETDRNQRAIYKEIVQQQLTDDAKCRIKAQEIIIVDFFTQLITQGKSIIALIEEKCQVKITLTQEEK